MSKVTLIVTAIPNPEEDESIQSYFKAAASVLTSNGGKIISQAKVNKALIGNIEFEWLIVVKVNSKEDIEAIFASEEYKEVIPLREKGFKKINIVLANSME